MICDLITKAICEQSCDADAVDKYVAGLDMRLDERFVLMVVFAGGRIAEFLDEDAQEKAMEIHDVFAECILRVEMFGGGGAKVKEEGMLGRPDSAAHRKSATLFRVRKSNITVARQPLLKNESLVKIISGCFN